MDRVVLITDINTPLGSALLVKYHTDGEKIIGTITPDNKDFSLPNWSDDGLEVLEWNRHSPVNSKNIILSVLKKYKKLDEVCLIQNMIGNDSFFHELDFKSIDKAIDNWIKGNFFLCREILKVFIQNASGVLVLINNIKCNSNITSPLFEAIRSSFRSFTKELSLTYGSHNIFINGFESTSNLSEDFGGFIYKRICEKMRNNSGRIIQFNKKKSFF